MNTEKAHAVRSYSLLMSTGLLLFHNEKANIKENGILLFMLSVILLLGITA
jgi:hypothetical protein